jgi:hypothetical protein
MAIDTRGRPPRRFPGHPLLYQLNTQVYLSERSAALGRLATLDDVEDNLLDRLARLGFTWLWLLGVWQTGEAGRTISRGNPALRQDYARWLPDFRDEDIVGSPFAVQRYETHADFGGDEALARLRERARRRGLRIMLDFVVNHVAQDHEWVATHPDWFVQGDEAEILAEPMNWGRFETRAGPRILAFGRDPYFPAWADTVQLDYRRSALRDAMIGELEKIAQRCDGVRCDMAMLVEPDVFARTWGTLDAAADERPYDEPGFFAQAIPHIRRNLPGFTFAAEVYWDLEWRLQRIGFDFTYDKRLYDRLVAGVARPVREHLRAEPDFQTRSIRFLENHDEPRASATVSPEMHRAAALIAFFVPGMRFFHDGQLEGRKMRVPMQLRRRAAEAVDIATSAFYQGVLDLLNEPVLHEGEFRLIEPLPAWDGNPTWDAFIAFTWTHRRDCRLIAVNYGPSRGQCYLRFNAPAPGMVELRDRLGPALYQRNGQELRERGLYLDLPARAYHFFDVQPA